MNELFAQLGVNWKMLAAQGFNFLVLVGILTFLVYKPLIKLMRERRERIEFGLAGADEVEQKLKEINALKKKEMQRAESAAVALLRKAEKDAKEKTKAIFVEAEEKAATVIRDAQKLSQQRHDEEMLRVKMEAQQLVKDAIVKVVNANPKAIDDALVAQAVKSLSK